MADLYASFGRFQGGTLEGLRDGKGSCSFANQYFSYNGMWAAGVLQGRGTLTLADGSVYDGAFQNGEMTGTGLRRWGTGASYSGQFVEGELHGRGVHISAEGAQYEGEWVAGKRHGQGVLTATSGDRYTGAFIHNRQSGVGTMHYISGDVYHGEWADNVRAGQGTMTFADGATLSGRWTNNAPHRLCSYSTQGGFCYNGAFVGGVATRAATHLVVAPYEEPASVLHLSEMSIAGCPAVAAGDGQLCISVSVLPFVEGGAPTPPTVSVPVSFPEGSAQIAWDDSLTVDVPVGTRRPAAVRLELRRGETVVATGSLSLEAPYALASGAAEHMRTAALVPLRTNDAEAAPIELSVSYAVALAPLPTPAQAEAGSAEVVGGQPGREPTAAAGNDVGVAPEAPPSIHAVGGRAMPPLALRCLRGENVEIAPAIMATVPAKAATGSAKAVKGPVKVPTQTIEVQEKSKYEVRLFKVPEEAGRCLSFTLSANVPVQQGAPDQPTAAQLRTWHLGAVLSNGDGTAVARLMAPEDAPAGKLQLRICDATPREVLDRLALPLMADVVVQVEMEAMPSVA